MSKTILIPTPLRPFVNQQEEVQTEALSIHEEMNDLANNFPKLNKPTLKDIQ